MRRSCACSKSPILPRGPSRNRELKRRDEEGRVAWAGEAAAAAAMGITLEPYVPPTMDDLPKMQTVFHEQHPFNIS